MWRETTRHAFACGLSPRTAALTSSRVASVTHRNGEAPNDGAEHEVAKTPVSPSRRGMAMELGSADSTPSRVVPHRTKSGLLGRRGAASGRGRRRLASRSTTRARSSPSTNDGTPTPLRTSAGWSSWRQCVPWALVFILVHVDRWQLNTNIYNSPAPQRNFRPYFIRGLTPPPAL